jgi:uncharacterized protein (TIGR03067 family)
MTMHLCLALATWLAAADNKDLDKLQGTWQRTSAVVNGKKLAQSEVDRQQLIIKGNHYTLKIGPMTRTGTLELRPGKTPKELDIMSDAGPNKGKVLKGIYELTGSTFRYVIAPPGKDRPTKFESKPGTSQSLYINQRGKP